VKISEAGQRHQATRKRANVCAISDLALENDPLICVLKPRCSFEVSSLTYHSPIITVLSQSTLQLTERTATLFKSQAHAENLRSSSWKARSRRRTRAGTLSPVKRRVSFEGQIDPSVATNHLVTLRRALSRTG
jgi:hypothetical protein